jgi:hypothetical protein
VNSKRKAKLHKIIKIEESDPKTTPKKRSVTFKKSKTKPFVKKLPKPSFKSVIKPEVICLLDSDEDSLPEVPPKKRDKKRIEKKQSDSEDYQFDDIEQVGQEFNLQIPFEIHSESLTISEREEFSNLTAYLTPPIEENDRTFEELLRQSMEGDPKRMIKRKP